MAAITDLDKVFFPLESVDAVVNLFREHLENREEPSLAFLCIILGALENNLTLNKNLPCRERLEDIEVKQKSDFTDCHSCSDTVIAKKDSAIPALQFSMIEALHEQFVTMIKGSIDMSAHTSKYTTVSLLKQISDVIWGMLTRTFYKDRAHLQTSFSLLTECKLDGFGMAISVIAACQTLGLTDVHLAVSEDHAWAVFGDPSNLESTEITWHGKGCEDKRGQSVGLSSERSWLYTIPVVCTRQMEVAAMVTAINTAINATTDSLDMAVLQQKLLWLLYDYGHLTKYPAALATLADLEEVTLSTDRPSSAALYLKSVESARLYYDNMYVYPYTYHGNYHYRRSNYKQALQCWAQAATVISRYNYNREDEEIYKEFLEIANEMIPNIMKTVSGEVTAGIGDPLMVVSSFASDVPLVSDPECYAFLLQFYDGLCLWEEGSSTPVLHITWATHALYSLNRFDVHARTNLLLKSDITEEQCKEDSTPNTVRSIKSKRLLEDNVLAKLKALKRTVQQTDIDSIAKDAMLRNRANVSEATRSDLMSGLLKSSTQEDVDALGEKLSIVLHSEKMVAMKDLLVSERLNSGAIKLQLTAQSQVQFKQNKFSSTVTELACNSDIGLDGTRKKLRRE